MALTFQKNAYQGKVYGVSNVSGIMAAGLAANSEIAQFRYADAAETTRKLRVLSVLLSAAVDTTGFTVGAGSFDIVPARAFTAAGTGGNTSTLTGNNGKFRTGQNTNIFGVSGEFRTASTAALGAGTKTLDSQGVGLVAAPFGAAGTLILPPTELLVIRDIQDVEPLVLGHQEGFVVRASVPVVGTWKFGITVVWAELSQ